MGRAPGAHLESLACGAMIGLLGLVHSWSVLKLVTHRNGSSRPTARVIAPRTRPLLHTALYCGAVATGGAQGHYIFVLQMYVVTLKYEFEAPTRSVTSANIS